jgi:hypothetical protein
MECEMVSNNVYSSISADKLFPRVWNLKVKALENAGTYLSDRVFPFVKSMFCQGHAGI